MADEKVELKSAEGFSTGIGFYLGGLDEVREQLKEGLAGMTSEHIGRRAVAGAHPIGALVLHIGEAEWWWIQCVIAGRKLSDDDRRVSHWDVLEDPDGFAAKGYSAQYCLDAIDEIRKRTLEHLGSFSDDDLDRLFEFERRGKTTEVSLRWVLHHLTDHEAQHKGQILMLKRLLSVADTRP
jgi:uncharacterized damage-inducible protein DinB